MRLIDIATYTCASCRYEWVAPDRGVIVRCPQCHGAVVTVANSRTETAPRV